MKTSYRVLYNDDGFCTYSTASRYQDIHRPVGLEQVQGYVDEAADAGVDVFMLCPNMYQLPGWRSEVDPYWQTRARDAVYPDTVVGKVLSRCREFLLDGNDLIALTHQRAKERGLSFFLTWRMLEAHGVTDPDMPGHSGFWHMHPEFRNNAEGASQWDQTLSFLYDEVRMRKLAFLDELTDRYILDGLELDFLRWPFFFPLDTPFAEKAPLLTAFVAQVRAMLDRKRLDIPIVARIPCRIAPLQAFGMDVARWVSDGSVQILNLSPFYLSQQEMDIEAFRAMVGDDIPIHCEMTHCMHWGKSIQLSTETTRKLTREMYHALAATYLDRGANGVSVFNFVYTRDNSFGHANRLDAREPDFEALQGITDPQFLAARPKHYFLGCNNHHYVGAGEPARDWWSTLPVTIDPGRDCRLPLYVADSHIAGTFDRAVMRLYSESAGLESMVVEARLGDTVLREIRVEDELFRQPYQECVPESHEAYKDFEVPLSVLQHGTNVFSVRCGPKKTAVLLHRLELALYR